MKSIFVGLIERNDTPVHYFHVVFTIKPEHAQKCLNGLDFIHIYRIYVKLHKNVHIIKFLELRNTLPNGENQNPLRGLLEEELEMHRQRQSATIFYTIYII